MMRKNLTVVLLLINTIFVVAQEAQEKKISYKFYGFVRNDFFYNTRLNKEGTDGLSVAYPLEVKKDINGKDLNAVPQSEMLSYGTRVGVDLSGIDVLGATTIAKIESDFSGTTGMNPLFRLRHAYVKLNWGKTELLAGQNWHPMYGEVKPNVLNLSAGSPFQPFARSPQLNLSYKVMDLRFIGAAIYQFQYSSDGPFDATSKSSTYIKNANMPELYIGLENKNKTWVFGAGGEMKKIAPRISGTVGSSTVKVNESLTSYACNIYGQYTNSLLSINTKVIYGQNLSDLCMINGYGVNSLDTITGKQTYTSFNLLSSWLNITYGKKWQIGVFGGYTQNLGSDKSLYEKAGKMSLFGNGISGNKMIGVMCKISPEISYNLTNFRMGIEYDYTVAEWGDVSPKDGIVRNADNVLNHRILGFMAYYF